MTKMDYVNIGGMNISKITLGTAQLGLDYGIANKAGKPNSQTAHEIMKLALKSGINTFDTAPTYGDSEQIIGSYAKQDFLNKSINVITKIPKIKCNTSPSFQEIYDIMKKSITTSTKRLKVRQISTCLLHDPSDMSAFGNLAVESLIKIKKEGLVQMIGVSVYTPVEVKKFLNFPNLDVIQVPVNVLDVRLVKGGLLNKLEKKGIIVFARSLFLQGLFFLDPQNLPSHLEKAKKPLLELNKISKELDMSIKEIALVFVRDLPGISSLILGVETANQLKNNIKLIQSPSMSSDVRQRLFDVFSKVSEEVINPSLWKK